MYEIAARKLPYTKFRQGKGKGKAKQLMIEISKGLRKPDLSGETSLRKFGVTGSFRKRMFSRGSH